MLVKVERMRPDTHGNIKKDHRSIDFGQDLILKDADVKYDLCAAIEHIGSESMGHYLCAKRNFVVV